MRWVILWVALSSWSFGAKISVFVGTKSDGIYSGELDEATGQLGPLTLAEEVRGSNFLTLSRDRSRLYSTAQFRKGQAGVASYRVKGLKLETINEATYPGRGLCHVSLDRTDRVLFAADYGGGSVVSFPVALDGRLGEVASFLEHEGLSVNVRRQTKPHAHSFYPGPENQFAYAPDLGIDRVEIYHFKTETAQLTRFGSAQVPPGSGPRHMKFGKRGRFAYVLNELTLTISVFARKKNGALERLKTGSVLPAGTDVEQMTCSEILISQDGAFAYTANRDIANRGRDSVSVMVIQPNGTLEHLQTVPAEVWIPRNINLTPSGKHLLVAGQKSNELVVLKVDLKSGKLTSAHSKSSVPKAMCVVFPR